MNDTATQVTRSNDIGEPPSPIAAYKAWRHAIESLNVGRVLRLYEPKDSVLWGTLAQKPLQGRGEIRTYFDDFLHRTYIRITTTDCRFRVVSDDIVIATGSYLFELGVPRKMNAAQKQAITVPARFTFVFRQQPGYRTWRIIEHHSSLFPPGAEQPSPSLS